jgi:hypothetical protein
MRSVVGRAAHAAPGSDSPNTNAVYTSSAAVRTWQKSGTVTSPAVATAVPTRAQPTPWRRCGQ